MQSDGLTRFAYKAYAHDFGPLDLSHITKFVSELSSLLQSPKLKSQQIFLYTSLSPAKKINSALLICTFLIIVHNKSAEEAFNLFSNVSFDQFCDASTEKNSFGLGLLDCLKGFEKAVKLGWYNIESFSVNDYETNSKPEFGGFNWIIPNKLLAFSCPDSEKANKVSSGLKLLSPEEYVPIFKNLQVSAIIRLNNKNYNSEKFVMHGFKFYEMYFIDGSIPSMSIVHNFLKVAEENSIIAVHCKAGLGRTGTLIGCYAMKHYGFTALEFMGWSRMCRPGSVLGPQQQFLVDLEKTCWKWGENFKNGVENEEETKENEEISEKMSEDLKFKAKFGDHHQGERLRNGLFRALSDKNWPKPAKSLFESKSAKKVAFSKSKPA